MSHEPTTDEQRQLASVQRELLSEFGDRLAPAQLEARFEAVVREFDAAPVRTFIPVLARRRARQSLIGAPEQASC